MRILNTLTLATLLASSTLAPAADVQPGADEAARTASEWAHRFNSGDAQALAGLYADDAVLMPPTDETLFSRDSIAAYWKKSLAGLANYDVQIVDAQAKGGLLYVAGVWSYERDAGNGRREVVGGNVLRVMERQGDGSWKLRAETWN